MDGLRWILLLAGALVILGVVFFSRRQAGNARGDAGNADEDDAPSPHGRMEPSIGDGSDGGEAMDPAGEQIDIEDVAPAGAVADAPQKIVTVRIVASDKKPFPGDELVLSLRGIGMRHGRFGIFHRYDGNDEDRIVFSAASLVEPGSFELENIKEQNIPGISLFMVLPGPIDGAEAFDQMMAASRTLTQSLGAELLDESGSSLSIQRERYLREEIIQYQLENRMA